MSDMNDFLAKIRLEFYDEADDLLDQCEESFLQISEGDRAMHLAQIFRAAHTIKGSGAAVGLDELVDFAHVFEDCLAVVRNSPERLTGALITLFLECVDAIRTKISLLRNGANTAWNVEDLITRLTQAHKDIHLETSVPSENPNGFGFFENELEPAKDQFSERWSKTVRPLEKVDVHDRQVAKKESTCVKIDAGRIDAVLDLVGELVVIKSQLTNNASTYPQDTQLQAVVTLLDKTVRELQDKALSISLTPLKPVFLKMQRMARDLSVKIEKPVEFSTFGEETELDRSVVDMLGEPLMHLVRNALDHGIESKEDRLKAGKSEKGSVCMIAAHTGGRVLVTIQDDGRGIDRNKVLTKAIERGLINSEKEGASLSNQEVYAFLLAPGFSTAEKITDISGRGVGLDVVRSQIERLKGSLTIDSIPGEGTSFILSLPITASVADGMVVEVGSGQYVIPMDRIKELVTIDSEKVATLGNDRKVLSIRDKVLPLLDGNYFLTANGRDEANNMAVVFDYQEKLYALQVKAVIGQMQVVMKPLNESFPKEVVAGAAIMGNGHVALIADMDGIARSYLNTKPSVSA